MPSGDVMRCVREHSGLPAICSPRIKWREKHTQKNLPVSGKHTFRCVTPPRTRTTQCNSICVMPPMTCRALAAIKTSPVRPGPFVVISNAPGTDNYYWMLIVLHLWHFRNIFIGTWASVYITIIDVAEFMELLCCDQWCYQWFILFCVFCKHCFTLKKRTETVMLSISCYFMFF